MQDAKLPAFGLREGAMFNDVIGNMMHAYVSMQNRNKVRQEYKDALWVEEVDTATKKTWLNWFNNVKETPPDKVTEQFNDLYSKDLSYRVESAPSDKARLELTRSLNGFGLEMMKNVMLLEARTNVKNTTLRLNDLFTSASEVIAKSDSPKVMFNQMMLLDKNITAAKASGMITDDLAQSFRKSVQLLGADAVEHFALNNPKLAKDVLDDLTELPLDRRTALEEKIVRISKTHNTLMEAEQDVALKANLAEIVNTGQDSGMFDIGVFKVVKGAGAAYKAVRDISTAHKMYSVHQSMIGQPESEIRRVLAGVEPGKDKSIDQDQQNDVRELAKRFAKDQISLLHKDPFTYSLQDPVLKEMQDNFIKSTAKDKASIYQSFMSASLAVQSRLGIPDADRSVVSHNDAVSMAANINAATPDQVERGFLDLMHQYGQYYPEVFRDLSRLPEGQRIDTSLQIVANHLGKPWLNDFIQAVRAPRDSLKLASADATEIETEMRSNKDIRAFQSAISATDPRNLTYITDYSDAIKTFASSLYLRGKAKNPGDAVDMATQLIISDAYSFGEMNGQKFAINKTIVADNSTVKSLTDVDADNISRQLDRILDPFSEYKGKFSIQSIDPDSIDDCVFIFPPEITKETRTRLIADAIRNNAYWVTSPDNQGVSLMIPGLGGTAAPMRTKDGKQISFTFQEILGKYGVTESAIERSAPFYGSTAQEKTTYNSEIGDTYNESARVDAIRKSPGGIEAWNKAHPDRKVQDKWHGREIPKQ
jgi:hypothetical protein